MKKILNPAFTLAEIMIVLTVIGVLTAILLPSAINSTPDENVMKFKKANSTLGTVIRELVNSDEYYSSGNLGKMPNGSDVSSATYFCETLADVMSTRNVSCSTAEENINDGHLHIAIVNGVDNTQEQKEKADEMCKKYPKNEIIASDGVVFYQVDPAHHYAVRYSEVTGRLYGNPGYWNDTLTKLPDGTVAGFTVNSPFDLIYKIFCIDVDGTEKGEDPFGYGIRADGKIFPGARASEWINKTIQNKE